ncbi:MAG: aspartate kinase [Deltaproteobacteria bacterium]|nr:aspartate kinase [Deltaproteobacteria bacterium]
MMLLVQKYGGSSVADVPRIRRVAARVARARRAGHDVVVVVSAMGNTTNELLALAREVSKAPGRRELDMLISVGERVSMALLAMALQEEGVPARSFTGSQSGIITDGAHANARVVEVRPGRVREALAQGEVAIVAGFQGVSRDREVTTLGRGGSDTTAVVLAAALRADECEICSDVDGVWSADPRAVPEAIKLDALTLDEALAMARNGAKVLYEEAVAWAHREGVVIRASATANDGGGTVIRPGVASPRVVAVVRDTELASGPLAFLSQLPGPCVRRADDRGLVVDLRNLHAAVPGLEPVATVAVVGTRVGSDPTLLAATLAAAEGRHEGFWAGADEVVFRVKCSGAASLEGHLHLALLSTSCMNAAP